MNRVLIVDDEELVLKVTANMVQSLGFVPMVAESAREALDIFRKEKPGLVITDLNLGGDMDGVSLCSKIRFEDHLVCVIAMTGYLNQYDLEFCLAAGFSDVLIKPVDIDDLASSIKCNLDRRQRWVANGRV